jgi:hypothetical protein
MHIAIGGRGIGSNPIGYVFMESVMGMFDSVMFKCPSCGAEIEAQSKCGECRLDRYDPSMVPVDVVAGLDKDVYCDKCKKSFVIVKPKYVQLWLGVEPRKLNIDGEYE